MSYKTDYNPIEYLERRAEYYRKKEVKIRNGGLDKVLLKKYDDEETRQRVNEELWNEANIMKTKFIKAANSLKRMGYITL